MNRRHPSDARLSSWVAGKTSPVSADHAQHCTQCQERLEQMTELEPQMRATLAADLTPPATFEQRLRERIAHKLTDREALALAADLFDVGLKTSQLFVETEPKEDDDDG